MSGIVEDKILSSKSRNIQHIVRVIISCTECVSIRVQESYMEQDPILSYNFRVFSSLIRLRLTEFELQCLV